MPDLQEKLIDLRELMSHKIRTLEELLKDDEGEPKSLLTPEEEIRHGKLTKEIEEFKVQIEQIEVQEKRIKEADALAQSMKRPVGVQGSMALAQPVDAAPAAPATRTSPMMELGYRYSEPKAFVQSFGNRIDGMEAAYKSGLSIRAAFYHDKKAQQLLRERYGVEQRALSEGVNTEGGFLVPPEMSTVIIDLREQYGVFRQNVRTVAMKGDLITVPRRAGGLTASFYGEGGGLTESDKTWNQITLTAKKSAILTLMSSELAEDAIINLADDIATEMGYAFALQEDTVGFTGAGTAAHGSIKGIQTLFEDNVGSYTGAVDAASGNDSHLTIDAADLATLQGTLPQYAHVGAKYYLSQFGFDVLLSRLGIAAGGNTMGDQANPTPPRWNGFDVVVSQVLRGSGTLNNQAMVMFGRLDLAATMGDRRGVEIALSKDRYFDTDQVALRGTVRFDVNVHDIGDASGAGPMVALMGNT